MGSGWLGGEKVSHKTKIIINTMTVIFIITGTIFLLKIFLNNNSNNYLSETIYLNNIINIILGIFSVISCIILYTRSKDSSIFMISLVYLAPLSGIITEQMFCFVGSNELVRFYNTNTFSSIIVVVIMLILLFRFSKVYKSLIRRKIIFSVIIVCISIFFAVLDRQLFNYFLNDNMIIGVSFGILLTLFYFIAAGCFLRRSFKENRSILTFFAGSIFLMAIKMIYIMYSYYFNYFNMRVTTVLLTSLYFFIIIVGASIELYLLDEESECLNVELEKFLSLVSNNRHTHMFICDRSLNISYMNNKIKEKYSYNIGKNEFKDIILQSEDIKMKLPNILFSLEKYNTWRGVIKDFARDEVVDCFIEMIHSREGKDEILVSYMNISENIKLEAEIAAHKLNDIKKAEYLSTLSHELKTPLNIFYSTIQLLDTFNESEKGEFIEAYDKYNDSLKLNCKRMLRLINNIIDTTRIDAGIYIPLFGNFEIVSIVEDIVNSAICFTKSKDIRITFDTNREEVFVKCDPIMIEKIVLNLISNSIKYSAKETEILVFVVVGEKQIKVIVQDNGIGIREDLKEKIFERFLRGDGSLNRLNEGSGIGLSIVKSMVDLHDGEIFVDSKIREGSRFEVCIPNVRIEGEPNLFYDYNSENTELELSDIY